MLRVRQEAAIFVEGDVTDKDQRDPTNAGVVYNSVLAGSEQFTGSIAGDVSSVPSRASEGGRESLGEAGRTGTPGSIVQHESNGLVSPGGHSAMRL